MRILEPYSKDWNLIRALAKMRISLFTSSTLSTYSNFIKNIMKSVSNIDKYWV